MTTNIDVAVDANVNTETDGQKVAITWFLRNACASNAQLAVVSNVCRRWRQFAVGVVASEAVALADGKREPSKISSAVEEGNAVEPNEVDTTSANKPSFSSIRRLLITDMARELLARQHQEQNQSNGNAATTTTSATQNEHTMHLHDNAEGNFCLAWFAPSGIKTISVSLGDDVDDDDEGMNDQTTTTQNHQNRRGRKVNTGRSVTCCTEWRGYRHATEVLIPFGFSTNFIRVSLICMILDVYSNNIIFLTTLSILKWRLSHQ